MAGQPEDEKVVLSSIHQAKGLEWSRVVVIGLSEGRFPNYRAAATADGLEEERRLFYVACTRAKTELVLTYPMLARDRYAMDVILEASRFVTELPPASSSAGRSSASRRRGAEGRRRSDWPGELSTSRPKRGKLDT